MAMAPIFIPTPPTNCCLLLLPLFGDLEPPLSAMVDHDKSRDREGNDEIPNIGLKARFGVVLVLALEFAGGGRESPQQVIMTRWGLMGLASQVEGEREPPTSCNDLLGLLGLASQVEGLREPPTSQNDLLGVVGAA